MFSHTSCYFIVVLWRGGWWSAEEGRGTVGSCYSTPDVMRRIMFCACNKSLRLVLVDQFLSCWASSSHTHTCTVTLTHTHAHSYTHTHGYTYTQLHSHMHSYMYTHTQLHSHTHTRTHTQLHTHAQLHSHTHTHSYTHTHTHTVTLTHTHTHSYTHTHTTHTHTHTVYTHTHNTHTHTVTLTHTHTHTQLHSLTHTHTQLHQLLSEQLADDLLDDTLSMEGEISLLSTPQHSGSPNLVSLKQHISMFINCIRSNLIVPIHIVQIQWTILWSPYNTARFIGPLVSIAWAGPPLLLQPMLVCPRVTTIIDRFHLAVV